MRAFTVVSCLSLLFVAVGTSPGCESSPPQRQEDLQSQPNCLLQRGASRTELHYRRTPKGPDPSNVQWLDPNLDFRDTFTKPAIALPPAAHGKSKKRRRARGKRTLQDNFVKPVTSLNSQEGSEQLGKLAMPADEEALFSRMPRAMSEAGGEQWARWATPLDEQALFNHMPSPAARFEEPLVEAGSIANRLGAEEALFNQVPSLAASFEEPLVAGSSMPTRPFADEAFFNPVPSPIAPMSAEGYMKKCSWQRTDVGIGAVISTTRCSTWDCKRKCCEPITPTILSKKEQCKNLCYCAQDKCKTECPSNCESKKDWKGQKWCTHPDRKQKCDSTSWGDSHFKNHECARTCCEQKLCSDKCKEAVMARCDGPLWRVGQNILSDCQTYYSKMHCVVCRADYWGYRLAQADLADNQTLQVSQWVSMRP